MTKLKQRTFHYRTERGFHRAFARLKATGASLVWYGTDRGYAIKALWVVVS